MPPSDLHSHVPHGLDVLRTYGEGFAGRKAELEALDRAWDEGAVRIFVLYAEGGAGKTRVISKWLTQMRDTGWRGVGRVFVHSFYSQGSGESQSASSEFFFEEALAHFGYTGPHLTDPAEQGQMLASLLVDHRGILVLDGLEPFLHPLSFDQGRLKDQALYSLFHSLAAGRLDDSSHGGLCIVTSRQPIVELQDKTGRTVVQQLLDRLDAAAGVELLRQLDIRGTPPELLEAVEDVRGHAYSLMLLGTYLRDTTADHEIRRRREIQLLEEDTRHRYHAQHLFGAYVRHLGDSSPEVAVLLLLGFFDRPAEEKLLTALRETKEPGLATLIEPLQNLPTDDWWVILHRLISLRLIDAPTSPSPPIDSHPLLREYFAEQLRTQFPEAWRAGHKLLFEFLCETTEDRPDTLSGLQPLYQAVAHGCLAGLHEQVRANIYRDRILRGTGNDGFYSTRMLGAIGADLGAVACFFTTPWTTLSPNLTPINQAWLLNQAAHDLQALGRLTEAVAPMRVALQMTVETNQWKNAATDANNLSELELMLGEVLAAVTVGEQSVTYADRSGDAFWQMASRTILADALHQAGRSSEAQAWFEEAEIRQAERQPERPILHSVQGFKYCNLLLSSEELAAWRRYVLATLGQYFPACGFVIQRASRAMTWAEQTEAPLLDIALNHLTLARATLYTSHSAALIPYTALEHATAAINRLRAASHVDYLPRGLLTRAWLRWLRDDEPGCREDLEEAWEIAERGPMPLVQADNLLYRARLFRDHAALAEARRLIEKHGYHRRDEELADAEAAAEAQGWGESQKSRTPPIEAPKPVPEPKSDEDSVRDQVFISYSHRDKKLMEELLTHLKPYLRSGAVTTWSDKQIASGSKWFDAIQAALRKTSVAVLLVSPSFLASDFIHEHEMGPLLKEAEAGGVKILWIQIRASSYEETPLKDNQAVVSPPDKPLAKMGAERDDAWVQICKEIKKAVKP